jgi:hypothetical protein
MAVEFEQPGMHGGEPFSIEKLRPSARVSGVVRPLCQFHLLWGWDLLSLCLGSLSFFGSSQKLRDGGGVGAPTPHPLGVQGGEAFSVEVEAKCEGFGAMCRMFPAFWLYS